MSSTQEQDDRSAPEVVTKYLYRYYSFPDDSLPRPEYESRLARIESIFSERKLFFPSPAKFNDPFDCRMEALEYPSDPKEWEEEAPGVLDRRHPGLSRQQKRAKLREWGKNKAYDSIDVEGLRRTLQTRVDEHGVLCLSEVFDDLLLWSHYANGHTGFCLQFRRANRFFRDALPVRYKKKCPIVPAFEDPEESDFYKALTTKHKGWSYEKEWRLFQIGCANQTFVFPEGSLTGVILGCRISEEHKRLLVDLAASMAVRPGIAKAKRNQMEYRLDFLRLKSYGGVLISDDIELG